MKSTLFILSFIFCSQAFAFPDVLFENGNTITWLSEENNCGLTYSEPETLVNDYKLVYLDEKSQVFTNISFFLGNQIPRFRGSKGEHHFLSRPDADYQIIIYPKTDDYSKADIVVKKAGWFRMKEIYSCSGAELL